MSYMNDELSRKVISIMEREMQSLGRTMLEKQCDELGIDVGDIHPEELPALASRISELMKTCGGYVKAKRVYSELRKLQDLDELAESQQSEESRREMQEDLAKASLHAGDWDKSLEYFSTLLDKAKARKDPIAMARYLRWMGILYKDRSEFGKAMNLLRQALKEATGSGNKDEMSRCQSVMGDIYWYNGDHGTALEFYNKAIEEAEGKEDLALAHIGIANVFNNRLEFSKAITHYVEALAILKNTDNHHQISRAYNNLGDVYLQMEDWDNALDTLMRGREISEEGDCHYVRAYILTNSAEALINLKRHDEAEVLLSESVVIFKEIGNKSGMASALSVKGLLARQRQDWQGMVIDYLLSMELFEDIDMPHYMAKCKRELALGYMDMGERDKARTELEDALEMFVDLNLEKSASMVRKDLDGLG